MQNIQAVQYANGIPFLGTKWTSHEVYINKIGHKNGFRFKPG